MPQRKPLGSLLFLPMGLASAIVGLLPWLITGMRLPLQNLWVTDTLPAAMPIGLLPFSQYYLALIVALLLMGSTIAGIVGRAVPARHPGTALVMLIIGVLIIQVGAIVQTAVTVSKGLREGADSTGYFTAVVGGAVAAIVLGLGLLALIARAPRAGALIGLTVAAIAFSSWLSGLVFPVGTVVAGSALTSVLLEVARYVPAVIIGVAIAWCGLTKVGCVIAAAVSLLLLWVGPTLVTAVSAAAGTRVLAHDPSEMRDYGVQVFRMALVMPELWLPSLALAVAVAAVGVVAVRTVRKRSSAAAAPPQGLT